MKSTAKETPLEAPRHVLISTRLAPPAEMARWFFEIYRIPYEERAHAPIFHAFDSIRRRVAVELPLVLTPEGPWVGVKQFLLGLDAKTRPGQRLLGETLAARAQTLDWIDLFYDKLFQPAVQIYYHFMLDHRETVTNYAADRAPAFQKLIVSKGFRWWRKAMRAGIKLDDFDLNATLAGVDEAFDAVEAACAAKPFLGGDQPGTADVVFASLSAPLIFPSKFAAPTPALAELPPAYREIVARYRARRGGRIAQDIYDAARPDPQPPIPPMKKPRRARSLTHRIVASRLTAIALRFLARVRPVLRLRGVVLAFSWERATEVLRRDGDFAIEPINAEKINTVSGPFILGMDRATREIFAQREAVYTALRAAQAAQIVPARAVLNAEARRLLDDAAARHRRIDVVNGYARLAAARSAAAMFGVAGPSEAELTRVLRAVFHGIFLNFNDAAAVREAAETAGQTLNGWISAEIARRGARPGNDVLGGLIRAQKCLRLPPAAVRWMLAGLMVGAVDTTTTAVAQAAQALLSRPRALRAARRDVDDPDRMLRWSYDALRHYPHNPIILRKAPRETMLGETRVSAGATVIAVTLAAMQDARRFPRPAQLLPDRNPRHYLHFGYGLHRCAGRDVNDYQIPMLLSHLLRAGADKVERFHTRGPFPDEVIVRLGADQ